MLNSDEIKEYGRSVVAQVKTLLKEDKAVVSGLSSQWVLIRNDFLPQEFLNDLSKASILHYHHPTLVAIDASALNHANGYDFINRPKIITPKALRQPKVPKKEVPWATDNKTPPPSLPKETKWWQHDCIQEFASGMTTYSPPTKDEERITRMEEYANETKGRDTEVHAFMNDRGKMEKYCIDNEKLCATVKHLETICNKANIAVPKITIDLGWHCSSSNYQRVNIALESLKELDQRALNAEVAHELAHVVLNHALIDPHYYHKNHPHMVQNGSSHPVLLQMEKDADFLGIVLNKDPLGFAHYLIQSARSKIKTIKTLIPEASLDGIVNNINNGISGDYHPPDRVRIHKAREMAEEKARAEKNR